MSGENPEMSDFNGFSARETKIISEIKRGLIIGQRKTLPGENPFFLLASFGANSTGTILDSHKIVGYSLLGAILMALSTNLIRKILK